MAHAAGNAGFTCRVRVYVDIPVLDGEIFHGEVTLVAYFVRAVGGPIALPLAREFARQQAVYIVWPFARGQLDQLARMTGVAVPPLPLLLIPRSQPGQ